VDVVAWLEWMGAVTCSVGSPGVGWVGGPARLSGGGAGAGPSGNRRSPRLGAIERDAGLAVSREVDMAGEDRLFRRSPGLIASWRRLYPMLPYTLRPESSLQRLTAMASGSDHVARSTASRGPRSARATCLRGWRLARRRNAHARRQ